jgi:hypothetical protein
MTWWNKIGLAAAITASALSIQPERALACGGCFVPPAENTQVTGHRMIMTIGMEQSTLYDQIQYTGAPESFAWVLPTKGKVDVGVSSDLVFNQLGADTTVQVAPPPLDCPSYDCGNADSLSTGSGMFAGGGGGAGPGGVQVIAQEVVGPYETVQLQASDPQALHKWLADHGYKLPSEIEPIVSAYVNDGFNFLAVKLVPGKGVQSMQPIRITTKGASVALPLRMVAAGTGATTTVTLFVLSEFRAETANFPTFTVAPEAVVWDYNQNRSTYTDLRDAGYKTSNGFGWLAESAQPYSDTGFRFRILSVVQVNTQQSGYGTEYEKAQAEAKADMDVLFAGLKSKSIWLTRLRAELSRQALGTDLVLQAASDQKQIQRFIQTTKWIGQQPACPPKPPGCGDSKSGSDPSGSDDFWASAVKRSRADGSGCAMGDSGLTESAIGGAVVAIAAAMWRRRRRSK